MNRESSNTAKAMPSGSSAGTLPRVFGFHHYVSLGLGYAIGLGWIFVPARMLLRDGPLAILLAIILSGLILYIISVSYRLLLEKKQQSGGEVVFAGDYVSKAASFAVFWLLAIGFTSYLLFYTSFSGIIFESLAPSLRSGALYSIAGSEFRLSLIVPGFIIALFVAFINYKSTRLAITCQLILTYSLVVMVCIASVVAFLQWDSANFKPWSETSGFVDSGQMLIVVTGMICWYLFGFSAIAQCAGEAREESTNQQVVTKAIFATIIVTTLFYLLIHLFIVAAMPWQEAATLSMPTAQIFQAMTGNEWAMKLVLVAGMLGIITTLNTCMIACSRAVITATQFGFLPQWFAEIDKTSGVPRNAIRFLSVFLIVGPFLALSWLATDMAPISFIAAFFFTCIAAIRMSSGANSPLLQRVCLYLGVLLSVAMAVSMVIPGAYYYLEWPGSYAFLAVCAVMGIGVYLSRNKQQA